MMTPLARIVLAFLIGLGLDFKVGSMRWAEVGLALSALWALGELVYKRRSSSALLVSRQSLLLLGTAFLYVVGTGMGDLVNNIPVPLATKGLLRSIVFCLDLIGMLFLAGNEWRTVIAVVAGEGCSDLLFFLMEGAKGDELWKFGLATPIFTGILVLVFRWPGRWTSALLAGFGVLNLALGFRSLGAPCLLVGVLALVIEPGYPITRLRITVASILALVVMVGAYVSFEATQDKRAAESNSERAALISIAWDGFLSSPLFGQGSGFSDDRAVTIAEHRLVDRGEQKQVAVQRDEGLTVHSQLLSALADTGIIGAAFFLFYGYLLLRAFPLALRFDHPGRVVSLVLLAIGLYDLLMTPLVGTARFDISLRAAIALTLTMAFSHGSSSPTDNRYE